MIAVALGYRKSYFDGAGLAHACSVCRELPEKRIDWGCEDPSDNEQLWIPCMRCGGDDAKCKLCAGVGWEAIRRCPWALLMPWSAELGMLHHYWPTALPLPGGLLDQPAQYIVAMQLLDYAKNLMERLLHEEREAKMQRSSGASERGTGNYSAS